MEILSFYVKAQTLRSYFDKTIGWILFAYVSILFSLSVLACCVSLYQYAGMRLSWVAGSFIYAASHAFIVRYQLVK